MSTNVDHSVVLTDLDLKAIGDLDLNLTGTGSTLPAIALRASPLDYSGVSVAVAQEAEAIAERIRARHRTNIIDTGKDLIRVKDQLGHGKFGPYLKHHFGWSESSAQNFMNAAREFGSTPKVIDLLPHGTVYRLASPGTPEDVRKAVKAEIDAGRVPDRDEVEARIFGAREADKAKREEERQKATAERQRKHQEREWRMHEKTLRKAGKIDAEIDAERTNWDTAEAKKEREKENKRDAKDATKQAGEADRNRREAEYERSREIAREAAKFLRKHLGPNFEGFRELIYNADYNEFDRAVNDKNPAPVIVAPVA